MRPWWSLIWAENAAARLVDRFLRSFVLLALGGQGKVNHHDGIFLDDADKQNYADQGNDVEVHVKKQKRQYCADSCGRKRGDNRNRMDVTFVENSQDDVNGQQRGDDQKRLGGERGLKGLEGSGKHSVDRARHAHLLLHLVDGGGSVAQRCAWREIKGYGDGGKLALVIDGERSNRRSVVRDGAERDFFANRRADINVV